MIPHLRLHLARFRRKRPIHEAADTRMFSNRLFSDEELAEMVVLVCRDVPMLPMRRFTDVGVAVVSPCY